MISLDELRKSPERAAELSAAERMEVRRVIAMLGLLLAEEPEREPEDRYLRKPEFMKEFTEVTANWLREHGAEISAGTQGVYSVNKYRALRQIKGMRRA